MLFTALVVLSTASAQSVITQTDSVIHNSLYSTLSSECVSVITVCVPTISSCAASLCEICTGLDITPSIEPCCAAPTPTACFSDYIAGKPLTYSTSSLPPPVATFDPSAAACSSVLSLSSNCAAATPDFAQLEFSSQSSCICSASGEYAPTVYDNFFSTCAAWVSTADPSEYSVAFENSGRPVVRTPCEYFATNPGAFPTTTGLTVTGSSNTPSASGVRSPSSASLAPDNMILGHQKIIVSIPPVADRILIDGSFSCLLLQLYSRFCNQ